MLQGIDIQMSTSVVRPKSIIYSWSGHAAIAKPYPTCNGAVLVIKLCLQKCKSRVGLRGCNGYRKRTLVHLKGFQQLNRRKGIKVIYTCI